MTYDCPGAGSLDYSPCRYGTSKLLFRGPQRQTDGPYVAVLGGSETYGKYVRDPYPALLERQIDRTVVNLGYMNAGADVFLNEPEILSLAIRADVTVIQLVGAHNMSNRFYAVHPRRNDRFLRASQILKSIYREFDFTEFHFTRHMLMALKRASAEKFTLLEQELKAAWIARMRLMLQRFPGKVVLLWVGDHHPAGAGRDDLGPDPLLIDAAMVAAIRPFATDYVHLTPSDAARAAGTTGMDFAPLDAPTAAELPGPRVHEEVANALAPVLLRHLK